MTAQALTVVPPESAPTVTTEQLELVRKTVAKDATPDELKLYLYDCARQGVHPLDKLLHFTKRAGKYTPITSIDLMRMRAADTGEYVGNDAYEFSGTLGRPDFTATARVWRLVQGQRVAFTRAARWSEYVPPQGQDHMWRKMPHVMLGKCAEAQALRAGFPRQLHGLYADEEMGGSETELPSTPPPEPTTISPAQQKKFFAVAGEHGWTKEQLKGFLAECGYDSTKEIPKDQYDDLLTALEKGRAPSELEEGG